MQGFQYGQGSRGPFIYNSMGIAYYIARVRNPVGKALRVLVRGDS